MYLFNYAFRDFFSEFYPDEIVTENEGNEEVLSSSLCISLKPYNKH